ncbi:hypothetical protein [Anabaena sp. UHCC 0399]|uniref:hypothetical protein n=1 Tax=Anabaena sp. UHCC 0399 TaxID=3110238 RepID=UPI002B1EC111|nr:hypothetical protein [Anabaena sp. UHCC 0399]MEA5567078.1 hypothetical protein [Anabaena sp. UHCC 0399]
MQETKLILNPSEILSLGASLRKIEQKLLKQNSSGGKSKIWFQGEEPYFDVFFEFEHTEIVWFQFTLRGKSLSWDDKKQQLQTGMTNELSIYDASFYAASKTVENDIKTDIEFIYLVKSILETRTKEAVFAQALELFN